MATRNDEMERLIDRIRAARNFDFRNYKRATLRRRIERRIAERRCRSAHEYVAFVDRHPEEIDALVSAMLIKVTSFFRDPETWETLASGPLAELLKRKRDGEEIRLWSAGCATGEEAYSLAILVLEILGSAASNYALKVFGTDVDEAAVAAARRGTYSPQQVEGLSKERLARWFQQVAEGWTVRKELRRVVVFGVNNLVSDAPISRLDVLACRNVFIYLDAALQRRVLSRFHYALRPDGLLLLGKSELIPFASKVFEPVDLSRRLYRRRGRAMPIPISEERVTGLAEQADVQRAVDESSRGLSALAQVEAEALASVPVPVIATTLDGTVTVWNRAAARLWHRSDADVVGKKLTSLALPGLPGDLLVEKTAAVREGKAERLGADVTVTVAGDGEQVLPLRAEVAAVTNAGNEMAGLVYFANDAGEVQRLQGELRAAVDERAHAVEDLQTTNEELQSSNEELETTNEELQSANEELQTTNEELQSTNEELETTNEELQSTNAELDATNRELAHRTEELNVLGFYQRHIIRSLSAAIAVLDPEGRITVWNLAAERLFGITESEAMGQLLWTLRIPIVTRALARRIRANLSKKLALRLDEIAYDLPGGGRGQAALSAIPLVDEDRVLGGLVIVEDLTRAAALAGQRRRASAPRARRRPAGDGKQAAEED